MYRYLSSKSLVLSPVKVALVACMVMLTQAVNAQNLTDRAAQQANQIQRENESRLRQSRLERARSANQVPGGQSPTAPALEASSSQEACIQVNSISTSGVTLLRSSDVENLVRTFTNRCLTLTELNNLLKQLTFLYIEKGYIASRAYLPEQDLSDGQLDVEVVEGSLEDVIVNQQAEKYRGQVATAFPGLQGRPVNLRDIEQGLDQFNRLKSNKATIELDAGKEPGSSVLIVNNEISKRWHATVSIDNLGSEATGIMQSKYSLSIDDALGLNDHWSFAYQRSMEEHPFNFSNQAPRGEAYTAALSLPSGYWTFAVDGSWNSYKSQIEGQVSTIDTSGVSRSINVDIARVIHRDQVSKTSLSGRFQWKDSENFILGSRIDASSRSLSIASVELSHGRQFLGGQLSGSIAYHQGIRAFDAFDDRKAPDGSPVGQFEKASFSLGYFKPLNLGGTKAYYSGSLSGQWSPDLLFGSEQMSIGGYSSVRGLREAAFFGNNAILTRHEVAVELPFSDEPNLLEAIGQLEAFGAIDYGRVFEQSHYDIAGGELTGATIGLRSRGGAINFDLSYSEIVSSSRNLSNSINNSGIFYARTSILF